MARAGLPELAIVGTLHTENLGIERLVSNVVANPHIRFVIVCGPDSRQAIGHLPGQSLVALAQSGIDERQRIIGAKGKRPVLRNLGIAAVEHFRGTREVIDLVGVSDLEAILAAVRSCARRDPGTGGTIRRQPRSRTREWQHPHADGLGSRGLFRDLPGRCPRHAFS